MTPSATDAAPDRALGVALLAPAAATVVAGGGLVSPALRLYRPLVRGRV